MHSLNYAQRPHFSRTRSERLLHGLSAACCVVCIAIVALFVLRRGGTGFVVGWSYIAVLTLFTAYALIKSVRSTGVWALWITDDHLHLSVPNEPERIIELANIEFIMKATYRGGNAPNVKYYLLLRDGGHVELPKQLTFPFFPLARAIRRAAPHVKRTDNDRHHYLDPARLTPSVPLRVIEASSAHASPHTRLAARLTPRHFNPLP